MLILNELLTITFSFQFSHFDLKFVLEKNYLRIEANGGQFNFIRSWIFSYLEYIHESWFLVSTLISFGLSMPLTFEGVKSMIIRF